MREGHIELMCKAFLISHFDVCMGDGLKGLYLIYVV